MELYAVHVIGWTSVAGELIVSFPLCIGICSTLENAEQMIAPAEYTLIANFAEINYFKPRMRRDGPPMYYIIKMAVDKRYTNPLEPASGYN